VQRPLDYAQGKGYTLRHDEKSAEVIDGQRVAGRPLWRSGRNRLKGRGLEVKKAELGLARGEQVGAGYRQTESSITQSSSFVKYIIVYHSNGAAIC
jgi:hypothetical protein